MLAGRDSMERADSICTYVHEHGKSRVLILPISCDAEPLRNVDIGIDDTIQMNADGPGLVLFSSGTTGLPKGVVLPRRCFSGEYAAQSSKSGGASLNYRPGHWIGGAGNLIRPVLSGRELYTIRVKSGKARAEAVLEAFRNYRITHASFSPELLRLMKELLIDQNGDFSEEERGKCASYFEGLSTINCSAGMLESSIKDFWIDLTGLPFKNVFAATELGGAALQGMSGIQVSTKFKASNCSQKTKGCTRI
jgi:malonyl-CoA/methylmalonyl-CoA synthetase